MRQASSLSAVFAALFLCAAGCTVGVGSIDQDPGDDDDGTGDPGDDPPPTTPVLRSILSGTFSPLAGFTSIAGRAQMVRTLEDKTVVDVQIRGLTPGLAYTAHVHAASCAFQGGGHYKIDPAVLDALPENELYIEMTATADGIGATQVTYDHLTRGEALAIVIHNPADGAKMACADLVPDDDGAVEASGTIAPFAAAEAGDQGIGGSVTMMRDGTGTHVSLSLTGLTQALTYGAHIHAEPCAVTEGGGHYKMDPTVVDPVEANELWPAVSAIDAGGSMSSTLDSPHRARYDAQSLVVHRVVDAATKPKVACADLTRTSWPAVATTGTAQTMASGTSAGLTISGTATMSRTLAGITQVTLNASGLAASTDYAAHVHSLPCSVQDGGGHYKFDPSVADPVETNEIWLKISTDASGAGTDSVWVNHTARGEAQSIVIHDADKNRLACYDLN
jgi:Cu/Zn superoxide dismutase